MFPQKTSAMRSFAFVGKLGVTGAATERPLEGVAEDPTGVGYNKRSPTKSGMTLRAGSGLERGDNCTRRASRQTASGLA